MEDIVYFIVDDWNYHSNEVNKIIEQLENEELKVNCTCYIYDMAIFYNITTTKQFIEKNNLQILYEFKSKKTEIHPEYDITKIGTDKNYIYLDV